ncbi:MAG: magnesium transporter [Leadbetterella sp.]
MATFELTNEYVSGINTALANRDLDFLNQELENLFPADIASIIYELEGTNAYQLFMMLDTEHGAEVLSNIESDDRKKFIKDYFTAEEIARYVNLFDSDDAVDFLKEQPITVRERIIASLEDREQARFILDLIHYPEDVAGGLMQKELVKVFINQTVSECVEEIRAQAENVDKVYAVYVVDADHKLKGIVSLKSIVLARKNTKIENIFDDDIVFVDTTVKGADIAQIMQKYDLEAIPVVNALGRLLGVIMIDDVIDFITEKAEEDIQVMTGITGEAEEDDSVWELAKARIPWLVIGVIGSLMAASVISYFESSLAQIAALAMFIPIMGSTGGNVGIQTSSLIVQSLADKSSIAISLGQRLSKVIRVAMINGLIVGLLTGLYVFAIGKPELFLVVCISLFSVVILSTFMGTITPLLLQRFGVNPAMASGPFITTANDLIGIGTYFTISYYLLT